LQGFVTTCIAAILTAPDQAAVAPLVELRRSGLGVLAIVIDPAPFLSEGDGRSGAVDDVVGALVARGVSVRVIGGESDWERTLCAEDERT
jgi:hypothetical protein